VGQVIGRSPISTAVGSHRLRHEGVVTLMAEATHGARWWLVQVRIHRQTVQ
jgi:hypothetical protein